jgi:hypothetical protein
MSRAVACIRARARVCVCVCTYLEAVSSLPRQAVYRSSPHVQTWPVDERAAKPVS